MLNAIIIPVFDYISSQFNNHVSMDRQSLCVLTQRGKSGLHRAGWRLMTAEGDLRASATEMMTAEFIR